MLDWIVRGVVLLDSHELAIVFECRFLVCTKEVRVEEALPAYPNWLFSFSRGKDLAALATTGSHRHSKACKGGVHARSNAKTFL